MTQPSPTTTAQPQPTTQPAIQSQPQSPQPVFTTLQNAILAAASGDRTSIFHLVLAIFTSARAAVRCLAEHYKTHHHLLTTETLARLKYCSARLEAIFYTIRHAPERFFSAAQLRPITRARAVLAHIWNQPVSFDPLIPYLTAPENCPRPPRSKVAPASCRPELSPTPDVSRPDSAPLATPRSALRTSPANPLLLNSPGRALASVLLQLAALYGLAVTPAPAPRPVHAATTPSAAPAAILEPKHQPIVSSSSLTSIPHADSHSPHSALRAPHFPQPPP